MGKAVSFQNRDRLLQLGIAIGMLRRLRGLSQEMLSEKAGISRTLLSCIEAPNLAYSFSVDVLFRLADALDMDPVELLRYSEFPDMMKHKE